MQHPSVVKRIRLNVPQAHAILNMRKKNYWEHSRGTGKSTGLAYAASEQARQMPRASFFLVGATYAQILSRTLPSTIEGLEMFNLHQGIDYVVGKHGKELGFPMPYQPPNQWNNIIHWSNGTIHQLISLDNPNTGRGLNSYGGLGDEAALLDPVRLYNNVKTTNRAQKAIFKNCSLLGAEFYASSTPITKEGKWFTDMEQQFFERPEEVYFGSFNSYWNAQNLRPGWFDEMEREAPSRLIYEAEILNIRPKVITDGFYANLVPERHYRTDYDNNYLENGLWLPKEKRVDIAFDCRQDNDLDRKAPLIVSLDFGVFNSLVVMQDRKDVNELRILNSMWVKNPKLLDDLFIEQFIPYYAPHQEKRIYLYGGHDGHSRGANSSKTYYQQIEELLRKHGWTVHVMAKPSAPAHSRKYMLINTMLKEIHPKLPKLRFNKHNCADLIVSLEHAEAKEGEKGIEKNKRHERNKKMAQEHTTHLSDAFDAPLYDKYYDIYSANANQDFGGIILLG
jgi:hypothetical protein